MGLGLVFWLASLKTAAAGEKQSWMGAPLRNVVVGITSGERRASNHRCGVASDQDWLRFCLRTRQWLPATRTPVRRERQRGYEITTLNEAGEKRPDKRTCQTPDRSTVMLLYQLTGELVFNHGKSNGLRPLNLATGNTNMVCNTIGARSELGALMNQMLLPLLHDPRPLMPSSEVLVSALHLLTCLLSA